MSNQMATALVLLRQARLNCKLYARGTKAWKIAQQKYEAAWKAVMDQKAADAFASYPPPGQTAGAHSVDCSPKMSIRDGWYATVDNLAADPRHGRHRSRRNRIAA